MLNIFEQEYYFVHFKEKWDGLLENVKEIVTTESIPLYHQVQKDEDEEDKIFNNFLKNLEREIEGVNEEFEKLRCRKASEHSKVSGFCFFSFLRTL